MEKRIRITFSIEELQTIVDTAVKNALKDLPVSKESAKTDDPILLSRQETADLLKISLVTLHDWTNTGILKSYKISGRVYYKKHEVLATVRSAVHRVK
jgi:hypothetical protein